MAMATYEELLAIVKMQQATIEELTEKLVKAEARIAELEEQLHKKNSILRNRRPENSLNMLI